MKEVPRYLQDPPLDIPILDWWARDYDYVYVILNPFFKVSGHSPKASFYGVVHHDNVTVQGVLDLVEKANRPLPNKAPSDFERIIKTTGEPIRWKDIQTAIKAKDFWEFARTVWLWTLEVKRTDRNPIIAEALTEYCDANSIYPPEEDTLPVILEPILYDYLTRLELKTVTLWSEWRDKSLQISTNDFARNRPDVCLPNEKLSGVSAPGFFLSWRFDDISGLLCLTEELRRKVDPLDIFEGFPVTASMYVDIFNPKSFFERRPMPSRN